MRARLGRPRPQQRTVHYANGRRIGSFNSIWRREPDGTWLVVFDKGCPACNCERGP